MRILDAMAKVAKLNVLIDRRLGQEAHAVSNRACVNAVTNENRVSNLQQGPPEPPRKPHVRSEDFYWDALDADGDFDGYLYIVSTRDGSHLRIPWCDLLSASEIGRRTNEVYGEVIQPKKEA